LGGSQRGGRPGKACSSSGGRKKPPRQTKRGPEEEKGKPSSGEGLKKRFYGTEKWGRSPLKDTSGAPREKMRASGQQAVGSGQPRPKARETTKKKKKEEEEGGGVGSFARLNNLERGK